MHYQKELIMLSVNDPNRGVVRIDHSLDGNIKVHYQGVDMGATGTVVSRDSKTLVVRFPGRSCWAGRASDRTYVSPEVHVLKILNGKHYGGDQSYEIIKAEAIIGWSEQRKKG